MRADIEKIEERNPTYRDDVIGDMYDEFPLGRCTAQNAAQLAAEILHILQNIFWDYCRAQNKPFPPPSFLRVWLQGDEIFHTNLSMPGPKKDWRIRPEKMVPIFKKNLLPITRSKQSDINYEYLEKFVAEQKMPDGMRAKDWEVDLGFKILQIAHEIPNSSLARLVLRASTATQKEINAARTAGFRLRGKIIKKYASPSK